MAAIHHLGFVVNKCGITHDVFLVVFITVQNLVRIGSVVLTLSKFNDFAIWLELPIHAPFGAVLRDITP